MVGYISKSKSVQRRKNPGGKEIGADGLVATTGERERAINIGSGFVGSVGLFAV